MSSFIIPQNAEPAVNTNIALPTRSSAEFTMSQNLSTNLMESTTHNWPLALVSRAAESSRRGQNQPSGANYSAENLDVPLLLTSLPPCVSNHTVESVEFTNNSSLAFEQRVSRAAVLMHRVMKVREEEQVQSRREINRREQEIRERRDRNGRQVREIDEASRWPEQQEAITGLWCKCIIEKVINF